MIVVNIRADLKPLQKAFVGFRARQVPFATALALTTLAKGVEADEDQATRDVFKSPTPFTQRGFAISPATKAKPVAVVFPKDIAETYIAPYVVGGDRSLGSKQAMIVPVDARTNQYGNLPKGALARYKGKPGVFVGSITTKAGKRISGVWQRPPIVAAGKRRKGMVKPKGHLKLLVEFKDTTPAPVHFPFYERANRYLRANAARAFDAAMRKALATQR